jgi:phospholipid/cholesterol/gamma-HCH transport system substrate-binding protein
MKPEAKVGLMFIAALTGLLLFALALGVVNPFSSAKELVVAYNYAGGIEVGSPVRVMGIKVGKVKDIQFNPTFKLENGEEVKLLMRISIDDEAWSTVRADSQFFINLAGVIGEKFLEISPGTTAAAELKSGQIVRGEDPPRIDQLISQSYGLAGKIFEMVEKNESSVVDTIKMMNDLVKNLNGLLKQIDTTTNKDARVIVKNLSTITSDMAYFSQKLRSKDGEETIQLMHKLIWRLEPLDSKQVRKFLQDEGIRARMF